MTDLGKFSVWFNPSIHLVLSIMLSLLTSVVAFRSVEMETETLRTFIIFYVILFLISLVFIFQRRFLSARTRQLIQFGFFLLGTVLMITALLSVIGRSLSMAAVFLLILFLPGVSIFRAGIHFKPPTAQNNSIFPNKKTSVEG